MNGMFVVLIYYVMLLCGESLIETKNLSPIIGIWTPNVIFGAAGIYLLIRAAKDRPITIPSIGDVIKIMTNKLGRYRS